MQDVREVRIDIGAWVDELNAKNVKIENEETIFDLTREGFNTGEIARMLVAARENGRAPLDILKPNKLLLYGGARREVAEKHERKTREEQPVKVREFIGRHFGHEDNAPDSGYVDTRSDEALRLATEYLLSVLPGHAVNHLRIIAMNGGDIDEVANGIVAELRSIVATVKRDMATEKV